MNSMGKFPKCLYSLLFVVVFHILYSFGINAESSVFSAKNWCFTNNSDSGFFSKLCKFCSISFTFTDMVL